RDIDSTVVQIAWSKKFDGKTCWRASPDGSLLAVAYAAVLVVIEVQQGLGNRLRWLIRHFRQNTCGVEHDRARELVILRLAARQRRKCNGRDCGTGTDQEFSPVDTTD